MPPGKGIWKPRIMLLGTVRVYKTLHTKKTGDVSMARESTLGRLERQLTDWKDKLTDWKRRSDWSERRLHCILFCQCEWWTSKTNRPAKRWLSRARLSKSSTSEIKRWWIRWTEANCIIVSMSRQHPFCQDFSHFHLHRQVVLFWDRWDKLGMCCVIVTLCIETTPQASLACPFLSPQRYAVATAEFVQAGWQKMNCTFTPLAPHYYYYYLVPCFRQLDF